MASSTTRPRDPASAPATVAPLAPACRDRTAASRRRSVEDAIGAMRKRLSEPLSLQAIAHEAAASPFHFDRIFRQVTGVQPFRFLSALRLDAARRLLFTTRFSATRICFEVGFNSVGSFTRQFSESVGLPPHRLRRFAVRTDAASLARALEVRDAGAAAPGPAVEGRVRAPEGFSGAVFVGLFRTPLPSGHPGACVLLHGGGPFRAAPVGYGTWHVFAAGVALPLAEKGGLLHEDVLRGAGGPVTVTEGGGVRGVEVVLRPGAAIDPPILVSLPLLLAERLAAAGLA
ncbi:MAG TPA: AraC family transcriptional regulator [Longimicrobium sp.]